MYMHATCALNWLLGTCATGDIGFPLTRGHRRTLKQ
jgi:hypothetical protein